MTRAMVKVCGMRERRNLEEIARLEPDYVGFIFHDRSPRYVGSGPALPREASGRAKRVGVFVDSPAAFIVSAIDQWKLDVAQLHGDEPPELCSELKKLRPVETWKAFRIGETFPRSLVQSYEGVVERFLFDAQGPAPGGNGVSFQWRVLVEYEGETPYLLAGGLGEDNIGEALSLLETRNALCGVDVSSRAEIAPGMKNPEVVARIIARVRGEGSKGNC